MLPSYFIYFGLEGRRKLKSDGRGSCDENVSQKDVALQQALDQISSSFGKGSIMWLGQSGFSNHVPVVSTGSFSLDIALGTGGLPKVICRFVFELTHTICTVIC